MRTITVDFETFYDAEFSLRKLQTDAYILDERFETIMVCLIDSDDGKEHIIAGTEQEIKEQLTDFCDWTEVAVRAHNTLFDGFIMTQRYGIKPKLWKDTLSQARMWIPYLKSHSLASVAEHLNIGKKGTAVYNMAGKRLADMSTDDWDSYVEYCFQDTRLCKQMGEHFDKFCQPLDLMLIDMTIRMFTEPKLVGDVELMRALHSDEVARKEGLLAMAELDKETLNSAEKFAKRLRKLGVEPPKKISPRTGKETYAFAKTDRDFTDLQEHENPEVQALVAARLGAKTTIAETRALRFVEMAERGPLPVYLQYWGAKTTGRYSGGNKVNWQNLPARGLSAGLRKALKAPAGRKVLVGDSSNIELRTVMALAGQEDAIEKIKHGVDMYCDFASRLFGKQVTKEDFAERFLGKTAMLGLQYGAGAARFQDMVRLASNTVEGIEPISLDFAFEVVTKYREMHPKIVDLWNHCNYVILPAIANNEFGTNVDVNSWFITQNGGFGRPGEAGVVYKDLSEEKGEWSYTMGNKRVKIYGAKVVENLCQHAAMKIVMWQTARINKKYPVALSVHDEAVCVPKIEELVDAQMYMEECLSLTPPWCRGYIPVVGETDSGDSYGDCK